jgi:hypothetical protein
MGKARRANHFPRRACPRRLRRDTMAARAGRNRLDGSMNGGENLSAVTSASGYIAGFIIKASRPMAQQVRGTIHQSGPSAEILSNAWSLPSIWNWWPATDERRRLGRCRLQNIQFVQHIASPIPTGGRKNADDLIHREMTGLCALCASCLPASSVVMTSSMAAIA